MRKRFRGNKPIATSRELEDGEKGASTGMLYAGKGSYEGTGVKATDGRDDQGKEGEFEKYVRNDGIEDVRRKS